MKTVLDHIRETDSFGVKIPILQNPRYRQIYDLFGKLGYDDSNPAEVALGHRFENAMTGLLGVNDAFAVPLEQALEQDAGLQQRIVNLAGDTQGIPLLDTALQNIQSGADPAQAVNQAYDQRFGTTKAATVTQVAAKDKNISAPIAPVPDPKAPEVQARKNPSEDPPNPSAGLAGLFPGLVNFLGPLLSKLSQFLDASIAQGGPLSGMAASIKPLLNTVLGFFHIDGGTNGAVALNTGATAPPPSPQVTTPPKTPAGNNENTSPDMIAKGLPPTPLTSPKDQVTEKSVVGMSEYQAARGNHRGMVLPVAVEKTSTAQPQPVSPDGSSMVTVAYGAMPKPDPTAKPGDKLATKNVPPLSRAPVPATPS